MARSCRHSSEEDGMQDKQKAAQNDAKSEQEHELEGTWCFYLPFLLVSTKHEQDASEYRKANNCKRPGNKWYITESQDWKFSSRNKCWLHSSGQNMLFYLSTYLFILRLHSSLPKAHSLESLEQSTGSQRTLAYFRKLPKACSGCKLRANHPKNTCSS